MTVQNKVRIGFHKSVQGAFTQDVIDDIKQQIVEKYNAELIEADFRKGVLIDGKVYVGDICLNDCDVYFWHDTLWPAKTGSDSYYVHLLRAIGRDAVVINSAESTEIVNDKLRAHELLRHASLPVAEYALVNSEDTQGIDEVFARLGGDVLVKSRFGGWGKGIVRCRSASDLKDIIEFAVASSGKQSQVLLERFYENDPASWTSVSMMGQKPIIGYRKPFSIGQSDWKVYDPDKIDGRGEMSEYVAPSPELCELAKQAQSALGKDIVGFDFIATAEGYKIVDENGRPGLYAHCLERAQINIADEIVSLVGSVIAGRADGGNRLTQVE